MRYWLLSGIPENWEIALKKGVWGVSEKARPLWEKVQPGDVVVFYATRKTGILGYGKVVEKYVDHTPLWPEEVKEGKAKWPYRLKIEVIKVFEKPKPKPEGVFVAFAINKLSQEAFKRIAEEC